MEKEIKDIYRLVRAVTMLPDIYLGITTERYGELLAITIKEGNVLVKVRKENKETYRRFSSFDTETKKEMADKARHMAMAICRSTPTMQEIISGLGR